MLNLFTSSIDVCNSGYCFGQTDNASPNFVNSFRRGRRNKRKASLRLFPDKPDTPAVPESWDASYYDPFVDEPALFKNFSRLAIEERAIIEFSDRFGALWRNEPGWPSFLEYENQILDMRDAIELWDGISQKRDELLERHVKWVRGKLDFCSSLTCDVKGVGGPVSFVEFRRPKKPPYRAGDLVGPATDLLDFVLADRGSLVGDLKPLRLPSNALTFKIEVDTLHKVLWLQFAMAIANEKQFRDCEFCGRAFELSPEMNRSDRVFCKDSCRVRSYRRRKARAIEMYAAGRSPKEIAKETGSEIDVITKWLKSEEN